jgi:hypothetical protein
MSICRRKKRKRRKGRKTNRVFTKMMDVLERDFARRVITGIFSNGPVGADKPTPLQTGPLTKELSRVI